MFRKFLTLITSIFLVTALSACNLPSGDSETTPTPDDIALTVTAISAPSDTPIPAVLDTATPSFTSTPELTSTPAVPQVTVSVNTNCRTGPSTQYDLIGALLVGQVGTVVGKNSQTGYWIINNPGKTGTCWLFNGYATVSGNTANLQEYSIPPTPTPSSTPTATYTPTLAIPAPVTNVTMEMTCPNASHSGTLKWEDKSNNEDGFNIYINNVLVASIPANSTSYAVAAAPGGPFAAGIASKFEVEAFNGAGKAAKVSVAQGCP